MPYSERRYGEPEASLNLAAVLTSFRNKPTAKGLAAAILAVAKSGRLRELLYGAWCFARYRPQPLLSAMQIPRAWLETVEARRVDGWFTVEQMRDHPLHGPFLTGVPEDSTFRGPAICRFGTLVVAGEYGEGKRLYHGEIGSRAKLSDHYLEDPDVRHIHCVYRVDDSRFIVTTGDVAKYLDIWSIGDGTPLFERRASRHLAGFTGAAAAASGIYLGSDFSGRPNYLVRLADQKKFFLPRPLWTDYIADMVSFEDRYIIVATSNLLCLGMKRSFILFDAVTEQYHAIEWQ